MDWKEIGPGEAPLRPRTLGPPQHQHRHRASGDVLRLPGDAGHDYGTIEEKGYRKLVVERDGRPAVIDNPKWKVSPTPLRPSCLIWTASCATPSHTTAWPMHSWPAACPGARPPDAGEIAGKSNLPAL